MNPPTNLPERMWALRLTQTGPLLDPAYPVPTLRAGEAILRVHRAGVCATDLQLLAGYKGGYRGVLGHEFVATVAAVDPSAGEVAQSWLGCRVVGELNTGCGACDLCRRGLAKHCRGRDSLGIIGRDGAFAEYVALPLANLHRVPEHVADRCAVFAEPLAAALQVLEQVHIGPDTRVIVVGDGRLGQLIARVLLLTGCGPVVIGRHADKLARLQTAGVSKTLLSDEFGQETELEPADVVVEATGSPFGFDTARACVRPGGTIVLKSTFAGDLLPVDVSGLVVDEVTVVGSRCGPFAPALRLLANRLVDVESLITAEYPLNLASVALEHAARRGVLKILLRMDAPGAPAALTDS